jgi:hypothetical protein
MASIVPLDEAIFLMIPGTSCLGPKGRAPKGLEDSAQGFNPGNRRPERFALKGRQIERTNNAKVGPIVARLNCAL